MPTISKFWCLFHQNHDKTLQFYHSGTDKTNIITHADRFPTSTDAVKASPDPAYWSPMYVDWFA